MGDLIRRISKSLREFTRRDTPEVSAERRRSPRFICSAPVVWEVGREQGEGELREGCYGVCSVRRCLPERASTPKLTVIETMGPVDITSSGSDA